MKLTQERTVSISYKCICRTAPLSLVGHFKGTISRDLRANVFFVNQILLLPCLQDFFQKFAQKYSIMEFWFLVGVLQQTVVIGFNDIIEHTVETQPA